jgi:RNA polymerase sigma-70 factor (ECF subfamily)
MERHSPSTTPVERAPASTEEGRLVEALQAGDEEAFVRLYRAYGPTMLRVAQLYVSSRAVAEEVVQETWLAVLTGIKGFEGRSSFKTWLFRILKNRGQSRAASEGRSVPFATLSDEELGVAEVSVVVDRFRGAGERWPDHWTSSPDRWTQLPEASLLSHETVAMVQGVVASLPPAQQAVVTLRDIVGWNAEEVCELLEITESNQRVLLHRARAKVRKAVEHHLGAS